MSETEKGINNRKITYLTLASIIAGCIAALFANLYFYLNSRNVSINDTLYDVLGLGSTIFIIFALVVGLKDIVCIIKSGFFKKGNFLKFLILLLTALFLIQITLYHLNVSKEKQYRLIEKYGKP
jgi:hypothetical protein